MGNDLEEGRPSTFIIEMKASADVPIREKQHGKSGPSIHVSLPTTRPTGDLETYVYLKRNKGINRG